MASREADVTALLAAWKKGDDEALDRIVSVVHRELKRLAGGLMRGERESHTLQPTALVNEAYLRLLDAAQVDWRDRNHFFSIAARVMRRVLVDHARQVNSARRGGGADKTQWRDAIEIPGMPGANLLDLDLALLKLERRDPRACKALELRFFAGLTNRETAAALGCSPATVKRDWTFARAWLRRELKSDSHHGRQKP